LTSFLKSVEPCQSQTFQTNKHKSSKFVNSKPYHNETLEHPCACQEIEKLESSGHLLKEVILHRRWWALPVMTEGDKVKLWHRFWTIDFWCRLPWFSYWRGAAAGRMRRRGGSGLWGRGSEGRVGAKTLERAAYERHTRDNVTALSTCSLQVGGRYPLSVEVR
jgi:hypothetical protein